MCQVLFLVTQIYQQTKQIPDFRELYSSRGSVLEDDKAIEVKKKKKSRVRENEGSGKVAKGYRLLF